MTRKKKCLLCNQYFLVENYKYSISKYCSRQCYYKSIKGRKMTWGNKLKLFKKRNKIRNTGKTRFQTGKPSWNKKLIGWNTGEFHANWQGGISKIGYSYKFNKYFKETIRKRNKYKCQMCGINEIKCNQKLHIHHIDYNKKNNQIKNLISLCITCHIKTNYNRKYWINYFKGEK